MGFFSFIYSTMIASLHIQLHPPDYFFRIYFKKMKLLGKGCKLLYEFWWHIAKWPCYKRQLIFPLVTYTWAYLPMLIPIFSQFSKYKWCIFIAISIYLISDEVRHFNVKFFLKKLITSFFLVLFMKIKKLWNVMLLGIHILRLFFAFTIMIF